MRRASRPVPGVLGNAGCERNCKPADSPQFRPCIAAIIGKDMAQPRPAIEYGFQDGRRAVAVLDVGSVNDGADQQAPACRRYAQSRVGARHGRSPPTFRSLHAGCKHSGRRLGQSIIVSIIAR